MTIQSCLLVSPSIKGQIDTSIVKLDCLRGKIFKPCLLEFWKTKRSYIFKLFSRSFCSCEFQRWRLTCLALGFILFLLLQVVSSWVPFYYRSLTAIGVLLVVIIILFSLDCTHFAPINTISGWSKLEARVCIYPLISSSNLEEWMVLDWVSFCTTKLLGSCAHLD